MKKDQHAICRFNESILINYFLGKSSLRGSYTTHSHNYKTHAESCCIGN
jgi:hypothetical protein